MKVSRVQCCFDFHCVDKNCWFGFWVSNPFIVSALASVHAADIIWPSNLVPLQLSLFISDSATGTQKPHCSFDIYGPNLQTVKPDSGQKVQRPVEPDTVHKLEGMFANKVVCRLIVINFAQIK